MRETDYTTSVVMLPEHYVSFHARPYVLKNLDRFCVAGNSILNVDTTFELTEAWWLTDNPYQNLSLVNEKGEHPDFPGPYMWSFKKNCPGYRRFAVECAAANPSLSDIKKVGADMDEALSGGLSDIFRNADKLYCMQHIQEADVRKLKALGANKENIGRIMADVYGSQRGSLMEFGLADCVDEEDFETKLTNLKSAWDRIVPGYHFWFTKNRSEKFVSNLIMSSRNTLGIGVRFPPMVWSWHTSCKKR